MSGIIKNGRPSVKEVNLSVDDKEECKTVIDWGLPDDPQNREENDYFGEGEDPFD